MEYNYNSDDEDINDYEISNFFTEEQIEKYNSIINYNGKIKVLQSHPLFMAYILLKCCYDENIFAKTWVYNNWCHMVTSNGKHKIYYDNTEMDIDGTVYFSIENDGNVTEFSYENFYETSNKLVRKDNIKIVITNRILRNEIVVDLLDTKMKLYEVLVHNLYSRHEITYNNNNVISLVDYNKVGKLFEFMIHSNGTETKIIYLNNKKMIKYTTHNGKFEISKDPNKIIYNTDGSIYKEEWYNNELLYKSIEYSMCNTTIRTQQLSIKCGQFVNVNEITTIL